MVATNQTHEPLLVNISEACKLLDVSSKTLYTMRASGEIPFIRLRTGRKGVRFSVRSLQEWIAQREASTTAVIGGGAK
jgi:excisionase family DNA binding protein